MNTGIAFEADDKPLSDILFETSRKYRVPRYQRPYAWGIEELTEFWDDLISNEEAYFIGSFIFNTEFEKQDEYVDIIDGQQRLITVTILLAAIRDITKEIDSQASELFQRKDIAIEDSEGNWTFRIRPAESLEDFFTKKIQENSQDIIESKPNSEEEERVKANYQFLKTRLLAEINRFQNKDSKLDSLKALRKKIRQLMVINVEISNEDDAYDIFETTNARGMELSVGHLLKNLIFKNIPPNKDRDLAKDKWSEITKNIEETDTELKRFIRYFWISKYAFVQEKKLYKEIKKKVAKSQWTDLLQDLWDDSAKYNLLLEGDRTDFQEFEKHGDKIFDSVFSIRLMKVSQCYVLLLSILRNYDRLGFDPYHTFQFIEKFTFQYSVICKLPGNRLEKIYSKYALEIDDKAKDGPSVKATRKLQSIFSRLENELKASPHQMQFLKNIFLIWY